MPSRTSSANSTGTQVVAHWRAQGNMLIGYGIAFAAGLGGIVALIIAAVTPGHGRQHERLTSPGAFGILMFTAVAIAVPFGVMWFSQIWKGGVWLYDDRLEVHSQFFGRSCDTWTLSDLSGVGLLFIGRGIGQLAEPLWNAVFWRSSDDISLESSIFMQPLLQGTTDEKIKATRAGKMMTAVYEQAQRIQGADGPIAHPVDPSPSALDALGTVLALWTPYGGLTDPHSPGSAPGLDVFKSPPGQAPPS